MDGPWRIGALAEAAGLTVRTLHHFDRLGLLRPSLRTATGHRLYTGDDVRRLYRVLALRHLGISLAEIARTLDDPGDLDATIAAQLARVEHDLGALRQLRHQLDAVSRTLHGTGAPSIDDLLRTMEAMMTTSHFTPEQLAQARARHAEPGFAQRFAQWQDRAATLVGALSGHRRAGTDPADPAVQDLAWQWTDLMGDLAGGDPATLASSYAKIEAKGAEAATRGVVTTDAWEYLKRAFAVGFGLPR